MKETKAQNNPEVRVDLVLQANVNLGVKARGLGVIKVMIKEVRVKGAKLGQNRRDQDLIKRAEVSLKEDTGAEVIDVQ